ncbi:McrC family protein [Alteromonas sp.]|jgi:5-methylcytosine-specific restriction enzyme subunit McrC|uniref:McrC family protein n=1 Tax=Alteromonas sp. TaxID=232 RepID=UPI0032D94994
MQIGYEQVFEFGYVCSVRSGRTIPNVSAIPDKAYQYLRHLSLCDDDESKLLRLRSVGGVEAIQFLNYVGVIVTPDGFHIEILPKVIKHAEHNDAILDSRRSLLNMLRALGMYRHIQTDAAHLEKQKMPLLEIFIRQFLSSVNQLVKRGIKRDYQPQSDNLFYLKGKLNINTQLKHNLVQQHRFCVDYDEYVPDITVNRLIKAALQKVLLMTRSAHNQRLARELEFVFADVSPISAQVLSKETVNLSRGMEHYKVPVAWSQLILQGMSPLSMRGDAHAFSLMFPLESVFESYVESVLRQTLPQRFTVKGQLQTSHLVTFDAKRMFRLKPDIAIYDGRELKLVLDTKWKLIDASKANGTDKFLLSQQDFYQMHAYGHKYLQGEGDLVLIYPLNDKFTAPLSSAFEFSSSLRLWVVPFDIHHQTNDGDRLKLPSQLIEQLTHTPDTPMVV